MSGELLHRYCPAAGPAQPPDGCGAGWKIWLIIGCTTVASPLALILNQRWTWLRPDRQTSIANIIPEDAVQMVDLEADDNVLFEDVSDEDDFS